MGIKELALNVSYSVMPGSRTAGQYKEHAETLYNYCCQNVNEFLSLCDNDSFHVGMAFNIIVSNMEETQNRMSSEATKFKFSLYASLLCLFKALQMGTMQSCIAAGGAIKLIDRCKDTSLRTVFAMLTGGTLSELIKSEPDDLLKRIDFIYKRLKYLLIQITRADEAFKDADMNLCNQGKKILSVFYNELREKFLGYEAMGILV